MRALVAHTECELSLTVASCKRTDPDAPTLIFEYPCVFRYLEFVLRED
jgi:hypothetical protein